MEFSEVVLEHVNCPLCNSDKSRKLFQSIDRLSNLPGVFSVVQCNNCSLMRTNPRPTKETMGFYYPENYTPYLITSDSRENNIQNKKRPFWKKILRVFFGDGNSRAEYIPKKLTPGRALEFGCSSGSYMEVLRNKGWEVDGIELSANASQVARNHGFSVFTGLLESAPNPLKKYELIVGWMVLEHLHEPKESLLRLSEWIEEDGYLVLSVPDCNAVWFKYFKDCDYGLQLPTHTTHFTPSSISKMLNECGWQVEKIFQQRTLGTIIPTLGYFLKKYFNHLGNLPEKLINYDKTFEKIDYWLYPVRILLASLKQSGRMTVWARKARSDRER
jgi:2-polyprenyl-3-methyl-5-hydroxy-6-metoxy-1,4-benzoquinol methylase